MAYHDVKWRKSGYGTQRVQGSRVQGLYTGYVKIWFHSRVIDRAVTVTKALERVRDLEKKGPLFVHALYTGGSSSPAGPGLASDGTRPSGGSTSPRTG